MPDRKESLEALLEKLIAYRDHAALTAAGRFNEAQALDICRQLADAQGAIDAVTAAARPIG